MFQKLVNISGAFATIALMFFFYSSVRDGFLWTIGPFDTIKVQYKWMDHETGDRLCVAKAPGENGVPCHKKTKKELNEYKLLWEMPEKALAQVAYSRK